MKRKHAGALICMLTALAVPLSAASADESVGWMAAFITLVAISVGTVLFFRSRKTKPWTREDFLQYSCQLTLDTNTAHRRLRLSEGNREVTRVEQDQPYPDHPERFDGWAQVLCTEGLSGRSYLEVDRRGRGGVGIAASYKAISRKGRGNDSALGYNDKSWWLFCSPYRCSFFRNGVRHNSSIRPSRIGVYLDHGAGTLSFYSVSDTMTLIHRVQTTFTQPLYLGFEVNPDSSVKLCDLG